MPKVTTEAGTLQNVTIDGKIVGFKFGVRLPRYRGNMLSLINGYYVTVDGEEFPQSAIKMEVNGKPPRSFDEIKKAVWEHWDFQETAYLHISKPGGLEPGMHEVLAVVSNFEQYGYNPMQDQKRVDEVVVPTAAGTGFGGPGIPVMLELK
ncbi:MAG: hypothetical protein GX257_10470 [Clostridiales bacterium]|nr:hypothetical protein [Clostridiales bacterium]